MTLRRNVDLTDKQCKIVQVSDLAVMTLLIKVYQEECNQLSRCMFQCKIIQKILLGNDQ